MIRKIDDYVIDNFFQKLTEKIQSRTNKTNFYITIILIKIFFIITIPSELSFLIKLNLIMKFLTGFFVLHFYTFLLFRIKACKILEEKYLDQNEMQTLNPLRYRDFIFRTTCLFLGSFTIILGILIFITTINFSKLVLALGALSITSAFYFMACTPATGKRLRELEKEKALNLNLEPAKVQI